MRLVVSWGRLVDRVMILLVMVQLVYTVESPVVTQVRPLFYFILFAFSQYFFFFSDTKLSYVMSEFYEDTNKNPQSCNFGGNATLNRAIPSASATAAASSCIANPSATFTPSAPTTSGGSSSSSGGGSGGSGTRSGSVSLTGGLDVVVGMGVMAIVGVMGAVWTLV